MNGFGGGEALAKHGATAKIPIRIVTAKEITAQDRLQLSGFVAAIMEKASFDQDRLLAEVRRAMSGRHLVA